MSASGLVLKGIVSMVDAGEPSLQAAVHGVPLVSLQPLHAVTNAVAVLTSRGRSRCSINQLLDSPSVPEYDVYSSSSMSKPVHSVAELMDRASETRGRQLSCFQEAMQRLLPDQCVTQNAATTSQENDTGPQLGTLEEHALPVDIAAHAIIDVIQEYRNIK